MSMSLSEQIYFYYDLIKNYETWVKLIIVETLVEVDII